MEGASAEVPHRQGRGDDGTAGEALWRSNLSLVVTAAVSALVLVRILVISRGNYTTALALLQTAGPGDVGSLIALTAVPLVVFGASGVAFRKAWNQAQGGRCPWIPLAVLAFTAFVSMYLLPRLAALALIELTVFAAGCGLQVERGRWPLWPMAVAAVAALASWLLLPPLITFALVTVSVFALGRALRLSSMNGDPPPTTDLALALPGLALSVMLFHDFIGAETVWLPGQVLRVEGRGEFAGYVLDETENHVIVLRELDRIVVRLDLAAVTFGEFCHPRGVPKGERPLVHAFLRSDANYRPCPKGVDQNEPPK